MRLWLSGAALVLLFLLVLGSTAPAHLVGRALPADTIRLSGYSGTIWEGEASSASVVTDEGWVQLGRVQWSLSQLYLLLLSPTADIESNWGQQRLKANVRLRPSGDIQVRGLDSSFSAALIKRWLPINLRGDVNVMVHELVLSEGEPQQGRGRVVWQRAAWRGTRGSRPLGDYVMQFNIPAARQVRGEVSTLAGPVRIEGSMNVDGRQYVVDARLSSDKPFDPELSNALTLMAVPEAGGFRLKFESEF